MAMTKEAFDAKPKRHTNIFFLYCSKRRADSDEALDKKDLANGYNALSEEAKEELKDELKRLTDGYQDEIANWKKKFGLSDSQIHQKREKSKKKKD